MNTICAKPLTITISSVAPLTPTGYWTLNEAGGGFTDRVDSVSGIHLVPTGVTDVGAPALFSNGVHFSGAFGGQGMQTGGIAALAHTAGTGYSFFGWFKLNAMGNGVPRAPYMAYNNANGQFLIEIGNNANPNRVHVENNDDSTDVTVTLGVWHFFHCFLDPVSNQTGFSLDNGANTMLPTPQPNAASAFGGLYLQTQWNSPDVGDMLFDEIGISCSAMLTPAQITYLYNGGAGRTWPL